MSTLSESQKNSLLLSGSRCPLRPGGKQRAKDSHLQGTASIREGSSEMGWRGGHSPPTAAGIQAKCSVSQITGKDEGEKEREGRGLGRVCPFALGLFSMKAGVRMVLGGSGPQ